jgi:hypothetical protein
LAKSSPEPLGEPLGLLLQRGNLGIGGVLGHGDEQLREIDVLQGRGLGRRIALVAQVLVGFGIADLDLRFDLAVAQAREQQLVAQVVAELARRDAFGRDTAAQLFDAEFVLACHGLLGLVDRHVVHLDAVFLRQLKLGTLGDQALEHEAREFSAGHALGLGVFAHKASDPRLHLGVGDGLGIDQRDDVLGRALHGRRSGRRGTALHRRRKARPRTHDVRDAAAGTQALRARRRGQRCKAAQGKEGTDVFHGVAQSSQS